MSVIDTDGIRGAPLPSQAEPVQQVQEFQEVDPALERFASGAELDEEEAKLGEKTGAVTVPGKKYTAEEVAAAEATAVNILGAAFAAIQDFTGNSYGLTEQAAIKTAKGIAPCLAKYRLTEPAEVFDRWGEEVQAALAIGALLAGVYREMKKGAENGNKPEQRATA